MENSWIVLIPPILVLLAAFFTRNVVVSLTLGILSAALVTCGCSPDNLGSLFSLIMRKLVEQSSLKDIWHQTGQYDHAYTGGFLICLGILIEFITHSGGLEAYGRVVRSWLQTSRQAETVSLIIAPLFFLDDYLNNLVGGSIIRPIFEQFGIAREKLAYILNALSSSQTLLIPASSWLAFIVMQLQAAGVSCASNPHTLVLAEPYTLFLHCLPYIFFPILSILSVWFIVCTGIEYGPMKVAQKAMVPTMPLAKGAVPGETVATGKIAYFVIPLASFLCGIPLIMALLGGWLPTHNSTGFCQALANTDLLFTALCWSSLIAVIISALFLWSARALTSLQLRSLTYSGAASMKNSLLLLLLAWTFASFLNSEVPAGAYLAHHIVTYAPYNAIPLFCFLVATLITGAVGSSWGMIGILLPLALPLITSLSNLLLPATAESFPLLLPVLGAIFSGAVAGPQFSPITDAAIISSSIARISPLQHIRTMAPYAVAPFISAALGFILIAYLPHHTGSLLFVLGLTCALTALLHTLAARYYLQYTQLKQAKTPYS